MLKVANGEFREPKTGRISFQTVVARTAMYSHQQTIGEQLQKGIHGSRTVRPRALNVLSTIS
jgi:hypothetical protein